ncbi:MAG: acyltransferase [Pseudomonadota bacterium]|nr:acyltransferase [Pseudomonadota bacterium]
MASAARQSRPTAFQPARTSTTGRFFGLELGRGLAALFVVIAHASMFTAQELQRNGVADTNAALPIGGRSVNLVCGVDFFFVLSGFIITYVHWKDIGAPHRVGNYVSQRFTRIYPAYWVIVVPLLLAYKLFPGVSSTYTPSLSKDVASVFLIGMPTEPALGVAWTLTHEILFYAIFAVAILSRRIGLTVLCVWATLIVANLFLAISAYPFSFLFASYNLEFILGMGVALLFVRRPIPCPGVLLTAGLAGLAIGLCAPPAAVSQENWGLFHLYFAACSAPIVAGLIELERAGRLRLPRFALFMGAVSYSVYLVHTEVEPRLNTILHRLHLRIPSPSLLILMMVAAGTVVGIVYTYRVEKPLTRWVRARLAPRSATPEPTTSKPLLLHPVLVTRRAFGRGDERR